VSDALFPPAEGGVNYTHNELTGHLHDQRAAVCSGRLRISCADLVLDFCKGEVLQRAMMIQKSESSAIDCPPIASDTP
jgi:hypothetical protein